MTWARYRTKQKLGRVIFLELKDSFVAGAALRASCATFVFTTSRGLVTGLWGVCKSGQNIAIKHLSFPSHSRSAPTHTHTRASTSCVSQILVKNTQMWAAYRYYQNTEAHCVATTLHPCFFGWHTHPPNHVALHVQLPMHGSLGQTISFHLQEMECHEEKLSNEIIFFCVQMWSFLSSSCSSSCSFRWAPVTEKACELTSSVSLFSQQPLVLLRSRGW